MIDLSLLGEFELNVDGQAVSLPTNARRLLALLALQTRPSRRSQVAGMLWLMSSEDRASSNLRTALWQADRHAPGIVVKASNSLRIAPDVHVDYHVVSGWARAAVAAGDGGPAADLGVPTLIAMALDPGPLGEDLLPDWDEDWVLLERERYRQLRLHALEAVCSLLSGMALHSHAIEVGCLAVASEPLRESAQRCLIEAHLADGNVSEARRQYQRFSSQLVEAFGIEPSAALFDLVHGGWAAPAPGAVAEQGPRRLSSR